MPLKYQTHRPPELLAEIRALWRKVDALYTPSSGTPITVGASGGGGQMEDTPSNAMRTWTQMVDIREFNLTPGETRSGSYDVAHITGAYTHLEIDAAVIAPSPIVPIFWTLRGHERFYVWYHSGSDPPVYGTQDFATIYGLTQLFSTGATGRVRPIPGLSDAIYDGDMAYYSVNPVDGNDSLKLIWETGVIPDLDPPLTAICHKVWMTGRYVVHDQSLAGAVCPAD